MQKIDISDCSGIGNNSPSASCEIIFANIENQNLGRYKL